MDIVAMFRERPEGLLSRVHFPGAIIFYDHSDVQSFKSISINRLRFFAKIRI